MDNDQIKKIVDSPLEFDDSKADSYGTIFKEMLSKQMRWVLIGLYAWFFLFLAPLIYSVIQFFRTDHVHLQILYASIFVVCWISIGIMKLYALIIYQKFSLRREVKRLELVIAELVERVDTN